MTVVFYSDKYLFIGTSKIETTRKAELIAKSLRVDPIDGIALREPDPLSIDVVEKVHSYDYIQSIITGQPRDLAESNSIEWDQGLWSAVSHSNGGLLQASLLAYTDNKNYGSLSSGLHHAYKDRGHGYCTLNGLAISAVQAYSKGARSILILDFDAHFGGGTYELLSDKGYVTHIDVSTDSFDDYEVKSPHKKILVQSSKDYLSKISEVLRDLKNTDFDLCLYNAGVDPYEHCRDGGLSGVTCEMLKERDLLVFAWCRDKNIPVAFSMAGGYYSKNYEDNKKQEEATLVGLHRNTIEASMC